MCLIRENWGLERGELKRLNADHYRVIPLSVEHSTDFEHKQ